MHVHGKVFFIPPYVYPGDNRILHKYITY
jgi:hypothetical protein